MKRIISLTIALCLVLGSFSFAFADGWTSSDSTTLSNIYRYMPTSSQITTISNTLSTINTRVLNIYDALFSNNHNITYWVRTISTWMSPIYNALSSIPTNHEEIKRLLGYVSSQDGVEVIDPYLAHLNHGVAWYLSKDAMRPGWVSSPNRTLYFYNESNGQLAQQSFNFADQGILGTLIFQDFVANENRAKFYTSFMGSWNGKYHRTNWTTLQDEEVTPTSGIRGITALLEYIQQPVARLTYVLASDERIEAQEAAAANEEAVVDYFIDSTSTGSVGVSDFGSLSDASGAMKSNFDTGQSAAGIFNVFDDSHFLYLSQSAADQLDTTGSNNQNRLLKSSGNDYDTPALDKYYEELNKILEVNKDD